ncbi:hypothetical protein [Salipaludibacillus daqingensis]|nr:hypothetical protein [Salipaludibacillus daqingensis]
MFSWFKRKSCDLCKGKLTSPTKYLNERDEEISVCFQCVPQAERKALRRK